MYLSATFFWWVDSTPVKDAPPLLTIGGHLGCDHAVKIASLPLVKNENLTKKPTLARVKCNQPHVLAWYWAANAFITVGKRRYERDIQSLHAASPR